MPWKEIDVKTQRMQFALAALQPGVNFRELCREYGISPKTGYKWRKRFREKGGAGLEDRPRRPKKSPGGLAEGVVCEMVRLKNAYPNWGPRKIKNLYERLNGEAPSESSFKRVFAKAGLVKRRRRRRADRSGALRSGRKAEESNEVWTIDFKGSWRVADGSRCEPLTVRDEHSRYVLEARIPASSDTKAVRACLEGLFERHGLPRAVRSDNGPPFACTHSGAFDLSRLSAWLLALGIDLERGRPGCPQDNGAHERMHADLAMEVEAFSAPTLVEQQAALDLWRTTYNEIRPHEALGMKTPAQVYENSPRKYEGTPADLSYEGMVARRVSSIGRIRLRGVSYFLSTALCGWSVGLKALDPNRMEVYFANLRIGELDLRAEAFLGAVGPEEGPSRQTA